MAGPRGRVPGPGRLTLTVLPGAARAAIGVLCGVLAVLAALVLALIAAYVGREGRTASAGLVFGLVVFAVMILLGAFLLLGVVLGYRAWLEGATLVVGGLFSSTRRRDLSTAPLSLGSSLGGTALVARDGTTGQPARLWLGPLKPPELAALADAITASGRQDPAGWQVAVALRQRSAPGLRR
jgi:hypothetical protein